MLRFYFNVWSGEGVSRGDCIFKIEYLHALSISDYKDILHLCAHKYTLTHTHWRTEHVCVGVSCCHLHALNAFVLFALLKAMLSGLFFVLYAKHTEFSLGKLNLRPMDRECWGRRIWT